MTAPSIQDDLHRAVTEAESRIGLPGLKKDADRSRFLDCLRESSRTIEMLTRGDVDLPPGVPAPEKIFPIKEAYRLRRCDPEEAIWLAFLSTHIGGDRPASCEQLYCAFGREPVWQWLRVRSEPGKFAQWLTSNHPRLSQAAPFGNHRKFETHRPGRGTPDTIRTYLELVGSSQAEFLRNRATGDDPFDTLYCAFAPVKRFGRTARYDLVRLLGYLDLVRVDRQAIRPGCCYLAGATGPLRGAQIVFGERPLAELEGRCRDLAASIGVGLDVMEDALCNWQKGSQP